MLISLKYISSISLILSITGIFYQKLQFNEGCNLIDVRKNEQNNNTNMKSITKTILLFCLCINVQAQPYLNLPQKDVFNIGFPNYFTFRGEMSNPNHASYAAWKISVNETTGLIQKFTDEELMLKPDEASVQSWVNRFAEEEPAKLTLLHFNGEARMPDRDYIHDLYFPGHWVYEVGSELTSNCSVSETKIKVKSTAPFSMKAYVNRAPNPERV